MVERLQIAGQYEGLPPLPELLLATDASVDKSLHSGAFIATTGEWEINAAINRPDRCQPSCVEAMELRAVWYGLRTFAAGTNLRVLADSEGALAHLRAWQGGAVALPHWYDDRRRGYYSDTGTPTLRSLQQRVHADARSLTFEHVKGHTGDLLNEAADGLAGIGLNYLRERYDAGEAQRRAASLAGSFLKSYAQS